MTDRDAIITRIESAMYESLDPHANYEGFSFDQLSAAVLAEIETTHVLVPRSLVERAALVRGRFDREVISNELARYGKPIRHAAAKADTTETP